MGRLDTAGFFKNLAFHGHSKKKLVPLDNDDYGNPTDPCDKCPEGYECDNGECIPVGPGPTPVPGPGPKIDPEPIDPENPTEQTQCKRYASRGNGIKYTENNTWTGYDWDSGGQWTFKCAEKLTFYGRLNHTEPHSGTYLVNDIRWGVGNVVRSFIVPENESLEQSIFRFNVNVDGTYLIEIKKKASGDYYYPWEVWEAGKLSEADGVNLFMGVSAGAEIWGETIQFPDEIEVLYEGTGGRIIHNITRREVTLIRSNGEELTIMDRNLGATAYMGQPGASTASSYGNYYQWGNNHPFTASGNQYTTTQTDTTGYSYNNPYSSNLFYTSTEDNYGMATHQDWANPHNNSLWGSGGSEITRQGPCSDGWHIPDALEMSDLFRMWGQITGIDIQENFNVNKQDKFCRNTLIPLAGLIRFTGGAPGYKEDTAFCWTTSVTRYNESSDSAYRGYISRYGLFVQPEGIASRIPAKCYGHSIRPFKNKTEVPKYTITFVNYDGTVLQSSKVYSGLLPQYRGETPTKPSDQQYSYTFIGWSPAITIVSGDQTYTAQYTPTMEGEYDFSNSSMTKDEIKALFNVVASGLDFNLTTDGIVPKNRSSSDSISLTTKNVRTGSGVTIQSIEVWYEVESGAGGNNLTEILSNQNYMSHTNYASSFDGTGFFRPNISVSGATFTETTARYGGHHPSGGQIYIRIDSEGIYGEYKDTYYNHTLTYSYTAEVAQQFLEILKNNGGLQYLRIMPRGRASIKNFKYKVVA